MLKDADIQKYQEDGFLIVSNFFGHHQIKLLLENWSVAQAQIQSGETQLQRVDRFLLGTLPPVIAGLYKDEQLVQVAGQVLDTNDIALYMNRILIKDEKWNAPVATHQDMPYFHGGTRKLAAFIPLQTHNDSTGGLKILKRSHQFGNLGMRGAIEHHQFSELEVVSPSLEVGDVLFMDFLTWHYSEAAKVECDRPLMQIAYQPATDGSYYSLEAPTLVSGEWQTTYFMALGQGIIQDMVLPGEDELRKKDSEIAQLKAELESSQAEYQTCLRQQHALVSQLQVLQSDMECVQSKIEGTESSKFWKLRNSWLRLKQSIWQGKV